MQASTTQFTVINPAGAVQAAVAILPGSGSIDLQPSPNAHGNITLIDTAGNAFKVSLSHTLYYCSRRKPLQLIYVACRMKD